MKSAENRKQPISVSNIQDFGVTKLRGVKRESRQEKWRRPVALYGPLAAGRSLDNRRQISCPSKPKSMTSSHAFQVEKNLQQRHRDRTGDQLPKDMQLASLLSTRPTDLEKQLTAQQHLLPDCAHTVTVINSRTRGPAPMMMGTLNEEASNHDARARQSSPNFDMIRPRAILKVVGMPKTDKSVFVVDALATSEVIAEPRLT